MKKILFFDTSWNQLLRIGSSLSGELKSIAEVQTFGLNYETSANKYNPSKDTHTFDDFLYTRKIEEVETCILKYRPDILVVVKSTVPDLVTIEIAQEVGAKVVVLQHGVLYDGASLNNVRVGEILAATTTKTAKTIDYLILMRRLCHRKNTSYFKLLREIIKKKRDVTTTVQNYFAPPLRGDAAFVIGEYWRKYYRDRFGYSLDSTYVMGNHDLDDLDLNRKPEEAICYIPSVHVEDGKVHEHVFIDFLKHLKSSIPQGMKFYIKLHPRSNKELYRKVFSDDEVTYVSVPEMPYTTVYVGHNSSLLSKALQITDGVILWGFKEEKDLFYRDFAYAVCEDGEDLNKTIAKALQESNHEKNKDIDKFAYRNPDGAYHYCSKKIMELFG